jgi:hypothetical protein
MPGDFRPDQQQDYGAKAGYQHAMITCKFDQLSHVFVS